MNITIEKISNGYVLTMDGKKIFCDVPAAICGLTSEWVLKHCDELDAKVDTYGDLSAKLAVAAQQNMMAQMAASPGSSANYSGIAAQASGISKLLASW